MGIWEDHLPRLNTSQRPIVHKYREGKVKSTPVRGVKQYLKPFTYKQWEGYARHSVRRRQLRSQRAVFEGCVAT